MKKLSFLLDAGIPFLQSLSFIEEREAKPGIKKKIAEAGRGIRAGMPIHKSFRVSPSLIDAQSIGMIESGEATGTLAKNCARISDDLEDRLANRNRLVGALMYPACIVSFAFVLVIVLVVFVFPKILPIVSSGGADIPLSTRAIIFISEFIKEKWLSMLIVCTAIPAGFIIVLKKNARIRKIFHRFILHIPFLSKVTRLTKSRVFAKTVGLFLESGYTLSESLHHIAALERNYAYKETYAEILENIKGGGRFSTALEAYPRLFPKESAQFCALGEESGNLAKTLFHLSRLFDEELREIERKLFSLLEPALMLFLAAVVGGIALSLISPVYSLTSSLNMPSP